MIEIKESTYILHTAHTTYAMRKTDTGHLEHLYYGRRIRTSTGIDNLIIRHEFPLGCSASYDSDHPAIILQDLCQEFSSTGKGDYRAGTFTGIFADGSRSFDPLVVSATVSEVSPYETLPTSYADLDRAAEALVIRLADPHRDLIVELSFIVYEECDVITRRTRIINEGDTPVTIDRICSGHLELPDGDYVYTGFAGAWAREMRKVDVPLVQGTHTAGSTSGVSSSTANPFFMISEASATEDAGICYGMNLVYSGNHAESAEVSEHGKTRILWGIHPETFSYPLTPGEVFEAPEAVMTCSHLGFCGMSANMHRFVRRHIVRGVWRDRVRPVLLNSWEAAYFKISESKLLSLAKAGKKVGIELFVMDDGWFDGRNDDTSSLGDWTADRKKLPGGIEGLSKKIHDLGMSFGIWVEPEMVNVKSRLYAAHPDWTLEIPKKPHSEGRNQRILDLSKREVQDYIIGAMSDVFSRNIDYVKWDMNRPMTDVFSQGGDAASQGSVAHRYMIGLYRVMKTLTEKFPDILFEGCASGGNRFDLGILSYFPQIWGSDNTDAMSRAEIETGYSYGYPLSTVGAHVSGVPNHQTLRITPLATRFAVASFGVLGYEVNLNDLPKEELEAVRQQIALYKSWREVFFFGDFHRGRTFRGHANERTQASLLSQGSGNLTEWTVVSPDQKRAVSMLLQLHAIPNAQYARLAPRGLDPDRIYHMTSPAFTRNIREFGDLVNTVSPVHIRQDSTMHHLLSKFYKLSGETEDVTACGDALMYGGIALSPAYGGTGFNDKTRVFEDYAARLYFFEETGGTA